MYFASLIELLAEDVVELQIMLCFQAQYFSKKQNEILIILIQSLVSLKTKKSSNCKK